MGFFKKKDTNPKTSDSLDIPPPPPMDAGSSDQMPPPPPMQDIPPMGGTDIPSPPSDFPPIGGGSADAVPPPPGMELPPLDDAAGMPPPPPGAVPLAADAPELPPLDAPAQDKQDSFDDMLEPSVAEESTPAPQAPSAAPISSGGQVFVEVSSYKGILRDLNKVKKELKQSDDEVEEIAGDISNEEKTFAKLYGHLSDIEQKLSDLENSLFS